LSSLKRRVRRIACVQMKNSRQRGCSIPSIHYMRDDRTCCLCVWCTEKRAVYIPYQSVGLRCRC
jgi:hypothetical protein